VQIKKSIAINVAGGAWNAALLVVTTPWFVSRLGLEGYGLIGFWMVLFYVSLIFDFGLGSTCARELARCIGRKADPHEFRALLRLFERPMLFVGATMLAIIALSAPWIGTTWLKIRGYSDAEMVLTIRWMAVSVSAQFLTAFYTLALGGLQKQGLMNAIQALGNSLRYLGGASTLALTGGITEFFAFQAVIAVFVLGVARHTLLRQIGPAAGWPVTTSNLALRDHVRFSGGMFLTAVLAAGVANADRLAVSKLLAAEMLGRYTIAATAIGLLQMFIFAFHRVYQPKFAELSAAGDTAGLRRAYYQACMTVGVTVIPLATVFGLYTPQIFQLWVGWADHETTLAARLLVAGFAMSGVMWLPASYQQAIGWTRLNVSLMAMALVVGLPLLVVCIGTFGVAGAAALMVTHGLIQLGVGLWMMNRVCFPGESLKWYWRVVVVPLLLALPVSLVMKWLMPVDAGALVIAGWIGANAAVVGLLIYRDRDRIRLVEADT
jgi:O-antigen/teichoic acid export membrane protein